MDSFLDHLKILGYIIFSFLFVYLDIPQEQLTILTALMVIDFCT